MTWKLCWEHKLKPNTGTSHLSQHPFPDRPGMPWKNSWSRWLPKLASFEVWFGSWKRSSITQLPPRMYPSTECHQFFFFFFRWLMKTRCHFKKSTPKKLPAHSSAEVHQLLADTGAKSGWYIWQVPGGLGQGWSWRIPYGDVSQSKSVWVLDPITEKCNTFILSWQHIFLEIPVKETSYEHCAIPSAIRFHSEAEAQIKQSTYVSSPYIKWPSARSHPPYAMTSAVCCPWSAQVLSSHGGGDEDQDRFWFNRLLDLIPKPNCDHSSKIF